MLHAHQGGAAHTHTFIGDPAHSPHLPHSPHSVCVVPRCTCAPLASLTAVRRTPGARRVSSQVNRSCSIVGCRLHPRLRMLNSWPLTLDNRPLVPWIVGPSETTNPTHATLTDRKPNRWFHHGYTTLHFQLATRGAPASRPTCTWARSESGSRRWRGGRRRGPRWGARDPWFRV